MLVIYKNTMEQKNNESVNFENNEFVNIKNNESVNIKKTKSDDKKKTTEQKKKSVNIKKTKSVNIKKNDFEKDDFDGKLGFGYENNKYNLDIDEGPPIYNITFTINNYNEKQIEYFKMLEYKYLIMFEEVGESKRTKHIQGFISLDLQKKKRLTTISRQLKKYAGKGCWMARSRGTPLDNKIYCQKDGKVIYEDGDVKLCGKGSQERKLQDMQALLDGGMSMEQLAQENFSMYIQYGKRLEAYQQLVETGDEYKRERYTDGVYVYGKTGCGKTTKIKNFFNKYTDKNYMGEISFDGKFYSSYKNQKIILLDDAKELQYNNLLDLINIKGWDMPRKNGYNKFNSRMVVVTDKCDFDHRFGGHTVSFDGREQKQIADEEISRRFKKFNFEDKEDRKNLFKYLKEKMVIYNEDIKGLDIVDDSDYD